MGLKLPFISNPTPVQIEGAIAQWRGGASEARRRDMRKRIDYYHDKQLEYLDDLLSKQFKYTDRLRLQREFYNCTKLIIDELAVIYGQEPVRRLENGTDKDEEIYNAIIDDSQFNSAMAEVNRMTKLCRTVAVKPTWRNGGLDIDIITPDMYEIVPDPLDPTKAKAVIFTTSYNFRNDKYFNRDDRVTRSDRFSEDEIIFSYWDANNVYRIAYRIDKGKEILEILNGDEGTDNPYGEIPIVTFHDGYVTNRYFLEGGDGLIVTNEYVNVKLTELNNLTKMQSFSVPVRKGMTDDKEFILDPSMAVDLPPDTDIQGGSDFRFVTPAAKITELTSDIQDRLRRLAITYRLNPDMFTASAQRSSAQSLQLQQSELEKIIKKDKPLYRLYEKKLFRIMKKVWNQHSDIDRFSEGVELSIDFADIEKPMTIQEKDQHNLLLYNNGIISKADWLMSENPDISTREEAENRLAEIKEERGPIDADAARDIGQGRGAERPAGRDDGRAGQDAEGLPA